MVSPAHSSPFPGLIAGLRRFRDRITGQEGSYRVALLAPGQSRAVVQIAREILAVVQQLLVWLRDGMAGLAEQLVPIDALLAVVESLGALVGALATALGPSSAAPPVGGLAEAHGGVTGSLGALGSLLATAPPTELLPSPETLAELEGLLRELVGPAHQDHPDADALGQLMTQLQQLAAA